MRQQTACIICQLHVYTWRHAFLCVLVIFLVVRFGSKREFVSATAPGSCFQFSARATTGTRPFGSLSQNLVELNGGQWGICGVELGFSKRTSSGSHGFW